METNKFSTLPIYSIGPPPQVKQIQTISITISVTIFQIIICTNKSRFDSMPGKYYFQQ